MLQSLAYGYVHADLYVNGESFAAAHQDLAAFADHEGFTLAQIFVEDEGNHTSAFAELMDAIKVNDVRCVIIPSLLHLGRLSGLRAAISARLKAEAVDLRVMHDSVDIPV